MRAANFLRDVDSTLNNHRGIQDHRRKNLCSGKIVLIRAGFRVIAGGAAARVAEKMAPDGHLYTRWISRMNAARNM
jgi:hypothetical protein